MRFKLVPVSVEATCVPPNCFADPSVMEVRSEAVQMCPRYPEPVPLEHPLPILKEALEKVCGEGGPEGHTAPGCFSRATGDMEDFATEHPWGRRWGEGEEENMQT